MESPDSLQSLDFDAMDEISARSTVAPSWMSDPPVFVASSTPFIIETAAKWLDIPVACVQGHMSQAMVNILVEEPTAELDTVAPRILEKMQEQIRIPNAIYVFLCSSALCVRYKGQVATEILERMSFIERRG